MSAALDTTPRAHRADDGRERRPSFARLIGVELRKMADTRAGLWLLIATGLVTAVVITIMSIVDLTKDDVHLTFRSFVTGMSAPMGILLPVLGILAITGEWGQRTALATFALVPSRTRVIAAKFATTIILALTAVVLGFAFGAAATELLGAISGEAPVWNLGLADAGYFLLLQVFGLATGFAFGTLFLNSALAIVLYFVYSFVLPGLLGIAAAALSSFDRVRVWIDFAYAQTPLQTGDMHGADWGHLATSGLIWFVLPLLLGVRRVLRAEVK